MICIKQWCSQNKWDCVVWCVYACVMMYGNVMFLAGENKSRIAAGEKSWILRFCWGWWMKMIVRKKLQERITPLGNKLMREWLCGEEMLCRRIPLINSAGDELQLLVIMKPVGDWIPVLWKERTLMGMIFSCDFTGNNLYTLLGIIFQSLLRMILSNSIGDIFILRWGW